MTTDQQRAAVLEANVQRLFGRLEAKAAVSQSDRARILALLLQTPATPQALPTHGGGVAGCAGRGWPRSC